MVADSPGASSILFSNSPSADSTNQDVVTPDNASASPNQSVCAEIE